MEALILDFGVLFLTKISHGYRPVELDGWMDSWHVTSRMTQYGPGGKKLVMINHVTTISVDTRLETSDGGMGLETLKQ